MDDYRRHCTDVHAVSRRREPLGAIAAGGRQIGLGSLVSRLQDLQRHNTARRFDRAEIVYVNAATPPTVDLLRAVRPSTGTKVVVHVHELEIGLELTLSARDRQWLLGRADHFIAASTPVAAMLTERYAVDPSAITTCQEFIDVDALRPVTRTAARANLGIPAEVGVVGSVGLPDWRKDPEHLLRAVASMDLPASELPWVLWIGGDPTSPDGRHLTDEARRLGLTDRFRHVAHQDDPSTLLAAMDVFALPAREDAMPLAALEAAATGLAIVCFRAGGIAGLCDAGAGVAVDYPDTVAFGTALGTLLDDHGARAAVGQTGAELVRAHHDLTIGVDRIAAVLDQASTGTPAS